MDTNWSVCATWRPSTNQGLYTRRRSEMLDALLNCQTMGVLLALAHEFDMPALTLRIKRLLLPPAGYLVDPTHANTPPANCSDFMKVQPHAVPVTRSCRARHMSPASIKTPITTSSAVFGPV